MGRLLGFLYGIAAYLVFFATFLYAIGFVAGIGVPKTIDMGPTTSLTAALIIDVVLMSMFALQHSIMARPQFKRVDEDHSARDRAQHLRAAASLALILLLWQWRPIPAVIWQVNNPSRRHDAHGVGSGRLADRARRAHS